MLVTLHRKAWAAAALTAGQGEKAALPTRWLTGWPQTTQEKCWVWNAGLVNTSLYHPNSQKVSVTASLKGPE